MIHFPVILVIKYHKGCEGAGAKAGDRLEVDLEKGKIHIPDRKVELEFPSLPEVMRKILSDGGLVEHIKKHGGFGI